MLRAILTKGEIKFIVSLKYILDRITQYATLHLEYYAHQMTMKRIHSV